MKPYLLILSLCAVTSCAVSPKLENVVLEGELAQAAFLEWQEVAEPGLKYPISFHSDISFEMEGFMPDIPGIKVSFGMRGDAILHNQQSLLARSDFWVDLLGYKVEAHLDWDVHEEEVVVRLRDTIYLHQLLHLNLPNAYRISGDRVQVAFDLLQEKIEGAILENPVAFPPDKPGNREILRGIGGLGTAFHPSLMPLLLMKSPGLVARRWEVKDDLVHVEYESAPGIWQEKGNGFPELGISTQKLVMTSSFDVLTGDVKALGIEMALSTNRLDSLHLVYTFSFSPIQAELAAINLADEEFVLDLDPYFDLIKAGKVEEIEQRLFQDLEALDQDISF